MIVLWCICIKIIAFSRRSGDIVAFSNVVLLLPPRKNVRWWNVIGAKSLRFEFSSWVFLHPLFILLKVSAFLSFIDINLQIRLYSHLISSFFLSFGWKSWISFCFPFPLISLVIGTNAFFLSRFESVYLDDDIRVAKDIRGDYLVVDRAPCSWKE